MNLDVLELEHISLDKGASNFLIGPSDEQFVVMVCLAKQEYKHVVIETVTLRN